jgi:hypothetical protein
MQSIYEGGWSVITPTKGKKEELIETTNPDWKDLSEAWYDPKEFEMYKKFNC